MARSGPFGALWDLDGVLADSREAHFLAWRRIARALGRDLDEAEFLPTFGLRNEETILALFGEMRPERVAEVTRAKETYFLESLDALRTTDGVPGLLDALGKRGFCQAVASSAPVENIEAMTRHLGLRGYFDVVTSGSEVARGKPFPDVFVEAARRIRVPVGSCVVFEDAPVGVDAALSAGCRCVAITTTNTAESLASADLVVSRLSRVDVEQIVAVITGGSADPAADLDPTP